ncbi:hypothetical protein AAH020_20910, partial [Bacteroides fragilis]
SSYHHWKELSKALLHSDYYALRPPYIRSTIVFVNMPALIWHRMYGEKLSRLPDVLFIVA